MIGQDLRYLIPAAMDHVYLNAAVIGPTPMSALTAATAAELEWQEVGPGHLPFYQGVRVEASRFQQRLQSLFPGGSVHLAYTHRQALMIVFYGMQWAPGDAIVTTDQEDATMLGAILEVARRFRLRVSILKVGQGDYLDQLEVALDASTRLVAVSHVSAETGWALAMADVAERLKPWPRVRLLVDGAHAWGHIDLDIEATGADFYVLCGHKWLMAPPPAAALWVRHFRAGELLTISPDEDREQRLTRLQALDWTIQGTQLSAPAIQPWPRLVGWGVCVDYFEEEGFGQHTAYHFELANELRTAIKDLKQVEVLDPKDPSMRTSLVVIRSRVLATKDFAERLWSQNIFVHPLSGERGIRASWASFNTQDDVQSLLQGIEAAHFTA